MTQQSLLSPGSSNREDVQTRLLHHRGDPDTSVAAAKRTREKLSRQHETVLYWVKRYGPGTCREIAGRVATINVMEEKTLVDRAVIYHIIERRIKALALAGCVREVGKRDGARVWEAT